MKNNSKLSTIILNDLFCYVKYVKNNAEHHIMKEEGIKTPYIPLLTHDRTRERQFYSMHVFFFNLHKNPFVFFFCNRASAASTLSEEIESMTDKLNYLKFDEVVQHLKYVSKIMA